MAEVEAWCDLQRATREIFGAAKIPLLAERGECAGDEGKRVARLDGKRIGRIRRVFDQYRFRKAFAGTEKVDDLGYGGFVQCARRGPSLGASRRRISASNRLRIGAK